MPSLVEVAFKGNRKEFFFWNGDEPLPTKAAVIVEADRGEDLGHVYATGELVEKRIAGVAHKPTEEEPVSREVRRLATPDEVKKVAELRDQDEIARRKAMERVKANNLVMKLTDAEWRWDRRKLTIYFTADKRVDFRNLVRELAAMFRTRIELKQIGVRDEAKRLGGIGRCGREYCSASWLPELRPVNLGVAKDQKLSLNPTQISGACGRLMCCLRYEHDFYVQQRKRFPKEGKIIETSKGEEKVISNDIFRERVTLRGPEGDVRIIPLAELRREWRNPPAGTQGLEEDASPYPYEQVTDEVLRLQDTSEMPVWRPEMEGGLAPLPPRGLPVLGRGERGRDAGAPAGGGEREGRERGEAKARGERTDRGERSDRGERGERGERGARRERDERRGERRSGAERAPSGERGGERTPGAPDAGDGVAARERGEPNDRRGARGSDRSGERGAARGSDRGGRQDDAERRGRGDRGGRGDRDQRRAVDRPASSSPADPGAPPPRDEVTAVGNGGDRRPGGDATPDVATDAETTGREGATSEERLDEQERRLRRRRGRRGGRRARGGSERGEGERGDGGDSGSGGDRDSSTDSGPGDGA